MRGSVAEAVVTITADTSGFKNTVSSSIPSAVNDSIDAGQGRVSTKSIAFGAAIGNLVADGVKKVAGIITSNIDAAISRVDTLNNFPKVMKNLGYSADDAAAALAKTSEHLQGLPTRLDNMAGGIQRLAPNFRTLDDAANFALGLNDALLAGGSSAESQAAAFEQVTQAVAKGNFDMSEWRSLQVAMPGQLDQVSKALLGTAGDTTQLYESLKDGTVSMEDFTSSIVKLDQEGGNGFASFRDQALDATDGLQTSIDNIKTAITNTLAGALEGLSPILQPVLDGLKDFVKDAGPKVKDLANEIADAFEWMGENMDIVKPIIAGVSAAIIAALVPAIVSATASTWAFTVALLANPLVWIALAVGGLVAALIWFFTETDTGKEIVKKAWDAIKTAVAAVSDWFENTLVPALTDAWEKIKEVANAAADWYKEHVAPLFEAAGELISTIWGKLQEKWDEIWTAIQAAWDVIGPPLIEFIKGAWNTASEVLSGVWENLKTVFETVWNTIKNVIETILGVIKGIIHTVTAAIKGDWSGVWNGIKEIFGSIWEGIKTQVTIAINYVKNIVSNTINTIKNVWSSVWNNVKSVFSNIWEGIKTGARSGIDAVYNTVKGIKNKITNFFANAGTWLLDSGKKIIQGLADGIKNAVSFATNAVSGVMDSVRSFLPFSPAKKGAFSGRGWTTYSGKSIMVGLAEGIASGEGIAVGATEDAMSAVGASIGGSFGDALVDAVRGTSDPLNTALGDLEDQFRDMIVETTPSLAPLDSDFKRWQDEVGSFGSSKATPELVGVGAEKTYGEISIVQNFNGPQSGQEIARELDWALRYGSYNSMIGEV